MENVYLLELIASMERELEEHEQGEFADNEQHIGCPERINTTIQALKKQLQPAAAVEPEPLEESEHFNCEPGTKTAVRGEELESVELLEKLAAELEKHGIAKEAEQARAHARRLLASQLNEFDGFNYDLPKQV